MSIQLDHIEFTLLDLIVAFYRFQNNLMAVQNMGGTVNLANSRFSKELDALKTVDQLPLPSGCITGKFFSQQSPFS